MVGRAVERRAPSLVGRRPEIMLDTPRHRALEDGLRGTLFRTRLPRAKQEAVLPAGQALHVDENALDRPAERFHHIHERTHRSAYLAFVRMSRSERGAKPALCRFGAARR